MRAAVVANAMTANVCLESQSPVGRCGWQRRSLCWGLPVGRHQATLDVPGEHDCLVWGPGPPEVGGGAGTVKGEAMDEEAIPIFRVADAATALAWYERLGFSKEWEHRFDPDCP